MIDERKPQITVIAIPSDKDEPDAELHPDTKIIVLKYSIIEEVINKSYEFKEKLYYLYFYNNEWITTDNKADIPIEIEEKTIISIKNGEIVSHKYVSTL